MYSMSCSGYVSRFGSLVNPIRYVILISCICLLLCPTCMLFTYGYSFCNTTLEGGYILCNTTLAGSVSTSVFSNDETQTGGDDVSFADIIYFTQVNITYSGNASFMSILFDDNTGDNGNSIQSGPINYTLAVYQDLNANTGNPPLLQLVVQSVPGYVVSPPEEVITLPLLANITVCTNNTDNVYYLAEWFNVG